MAAKCAELFNGNQMPLIGLGTGSILPEEMDIAISTALEVGYRHFDCAVAYKSQPDVGKALKKCLDKGMVKREELFITSKLPHTGVHPDRVELFMKKALQQLQLSYVDMFLIHFPIGFKYTENSEDYFPMENGLVLLDGYDDIVAVWKEMEKQVTAGRTKSIGLSNFNSDQINRILKECTIQPANLQVEVHLYCQQRNLQTVCAKNNIVISAYAALGSLKRRAAFAYMYLLSYEESYSDADFEIWAIVMLEPAKGLQNIMEDPTVKEIAAKHQKTPAQVLLNFLVSQNISVLPKSSSPARIKDNFQIFDIVLSPSEKEKLISLDKGEDGRTYLYSEFFKGGNCKTPKAGTTTVIIMAQKLSAEIVFVKDGDSSKSKTRVKMFSVGLQVRPKELDFYDDRNGIAARKNQPPRTNYYRDENGELIPEEDLGDVYTDSYRRNSIGVGPDGELVIKKRPKMYNVSLEVGPGLITREMLTGEYGQGYRPLSDWEKGIGKAKMYDVSCACGPQGITPDMLIGEYGQDFSEELEEYMKYTPSEFETKILLQRKESKQHDAITLSRPAGYKELELSLNYPPITFNVGIQVIESEVEHDLALGRHVSLNENSLWPTNDEFTQERAEKRIEDYISRHWSLDPNWLFHISFIQMSCTASRKKFIYEIKFSMPSAQSPVPSATASVFFILEVGNYDAQRESIKVRYIVEGTRYQHQPGAITFQQKWLRGIIVEKAKLQRLADF